MLDTVVLVLVPKRRSGPLLLQGMGSLSLGLWRKMFIQVMEATRPYHWVPTFLLGFISHTPPLSGPPSFLPPHPHFFAFQCKGSQGAGAMLVSHWASFPIQKLSLVEENPSLLHPLGLTNVHSKSLCVSAGVVAHTSNLSAWDVEAGRSGV